MRIKLYNEGKFLLGCKYVYLEPFATGTSRKFTFRYLNNYSNNKALDLIRNCEISDEIEIAICYYKVKGWTPIYRFKIYIKDYGEVDKDAWWVSGLVYDDFFKEYRQGVVDVFNLWDKGQDINWNDLPEKSQLKEEYISCCWYYSRLPQQITERESYKFDMSLIKEEEDFYYFAGIEFVGEKGYFGRSFFTFKDCLLEVYHRGGLAKQRKIIFCNFKKIANTEVQQLYHDVKEVFSNFKFIIEEQEGDC